MRLPVLFPALVSARLTGLRALRCLGASLALAAAASPMARSQQTVVANYGDGSLMLVDLATGDRTVLSGSGVGTGPLIEGPVGTAREANGTILLGEEFGSSGPSIFRVDPATGNRTLFSGPGVGTGDSLSQIYGLAVQSNGQIIASSFGNQTLYRIDPATGDRTVLASPTVGSGATMRGPFGLLIDSDGTIVFAPWQSANEILRVDPATGVRTIVSSASVGTGPALVNPPGVVKLADGDLAILNNSGSDYVLRVDPATGNRTVLSSASVGTGPAIGLRYSLATDTVGNLYVADFGNNCIVKIDPATGNRTIVSSTTVGSGPDFNYPLGMLGGAVASIVGGDEPPVLTSPSLASGTYGSVFSYTITADHAPTSFSASGLPAGLSLDPSSGVVSGTPTTSGTFTATLSATNAAGTASSTVTFDLAPAPLVVTATAGQSKPFGSADPVFGYTITSGALVGSDQLSGALARTPGESVGAYPFTIGTLSAGADYQLSFVSADFAITAGSATLTLGGTATTYDGTPKPVAVVTSPVGLDVAVTYNGSTTAPSDAGSYAVFATLTDPNYSGSTSGTLTIARATQTITFGNLGAPTLGQPVTLAATASSGLPLTFSVVSGPATLQGESLTISATDPVVVVKAIQAGDSNHLPASAQYSFSRPGQLSQSITFGPLNDRSATEPAATLAATASSGLPVSFAVVSGPALLEGGRLTLTGAPGRVVVRASQAGNSTYLPAAEVTQSFTVHAVGPQVYFGQIGAGDQAREFAAELGGPGRPATLLGTLPNGDGFIVSFVPGADGNWSAEATIFPAPPSSLSAAQSSSGSVRFSAPKSGATTFRGSVHDGVLSGSIDEWGLSFFATLEPPTGPTMDLAGYYPASSLNSAAGQAYAVVGTQGHLYLLVIGSSFLSGESGSVDGSGAFQLATADALTVIGRVDAEATSVTGTVVLADGATSGFSGVRDSTARTDRLINLSTRARVAAGEATGTLITGFVIGGTEPKAVLLRGIGPTLAGFGLPQTLADPKLRVFNAAGQIVAENDNWGGNPELAATMARLGAFALPTDSRDAALLLELTPGVYSVHVLNGGQGGLALAEIYDAAINPAADYQRLINISSRGQVTSGDGVLIGGFAVTGNAPKRVLIRGAGPALAAYGVAQPLGDPRLRLYNANGELIAENNEWETPGPLGHVQVSASADELARVNTLVGAFAFAAGSKDAALVVTLAPGNYTAHLSSATGGSGVALVEIYEVVE